MTHQEYQEYLEQIVKVMSEDVDKDLCLQDCCFKREASNRLYDLAKATKVMAEFLLLRHPQDDESSIGLAELADSAAGSMSSTSDI